MSDPTKPTSDTAEVAARWAREAAAMQATPYPMRDVVTLLANAADHLLHDHNCDTHGWELLGRARDEARAVLARLEAPVEAASEAPVEAARSLAEVGRTAAREAQRAALLGALEACGWRLTYASRALGLGRGVGNIQRAIRLLDLVEEYEIAKASGQVRRGRPRKNVSALTPFSECATVAA